MTDQPDSATAPTWAQLIRAHGQERADRVALRYLDRVTTYGQLDTRSSQVAAGLIRLGISAGDRVAVLDKNSPEFLEVFFGAAKCNAVMVPVNWRLAGPEIGFILADAEVKVLFVGAEFAAVAAELADRLPHLERVFVIGSEDADRVYADWMESQQAMDPGAVPAIGDVAAQIYTSGTTGRPKGVMLTNANMLGREREICRAWRYSEHTVNLAAMPLFHVGGLGAVTLCLVMGGETVLLREVDADVMAEAIPRYGVTHSFMVPAVVQFILDRPGSGDVDWSSLEVIVYGSAPITDTLLKRAISTLKCDFVQAYGLTESNGVATYLAPEFHDPENRPDLLRSCGRPFPWVELRIVDPDLAADVAVGEVGEIWIRTSEVTPGYWKNPVASAEALTPEGWLRTGDAGYIDGEGFVYLHDRMKDMVVSGGENIYPAEIENAVMRYPGVADVAVIGVPHERWGETPIALVVPIDGEVLVPSDIVDFCRSQLARFKCPTSVEIVHGLPRNPSGKVLKRELRATYWAGRERLVN